MKGICFKGIFWGIIAIAIIDILGAISGIFLFVPDLSETAINQNQNFLLWGLTIGTLATVIGGFIAARYARTAPYTHAAIIGLLGILSGLLNLGKAPFWFDLAGFLTVIPAALLGGFLAKNIIHDANHTH